MKLFRQALIFTFLAHGAAMLGMAAFLLPLVPGGGGAGDDVERMIRIADSPVAYRLGWLGWQITAVSDIVFAIALLRITKPGTRPRTFAIVTAVLVGLAVLPDQAAQFLLVTRGVELAREGAEVRDATDFLAFEGVMFPLTSGWAAILYTGAAIAWTLTLRVRGTWSKLLGRLSPPMLLLFVAISLAPLVPRAVRPSPELIGAGNALAFTVLEAWFVAVWIVIRKPSLE
ncbi:MAG: hypothetical protein KIT84_28520 [Labilithrix sp.]|nr:hypothetical protein [Labilithrix sp.]MCW5815004.1 hypothetical protein [Labilithrix sp.]